MGEVALQIEKLKKGRNSMAGMNKKTIKGVLKRKFDDFLESIEGDDLRKEVSKNSIITGGCIASMLLGEKINDYDVYFTNIDTARKVAEYYLDKFKGSHVLTNYESKSYVDVTEDTAKPGRQRVRLIISPGMLGENEEEIVDEDHDIVLKENSTVEGTNKKYRPLYLTSNAITLSDRIQLIIRFWGNHEEIHKNFDFAHCKNYWTSADGELVLKQDALESLLAKDLVYKGSLYPICSLFRIRKYIKRDWKCNAGQIFKACMQVSDLDLEDINVIEDQLTGVDVAYFMEIVEIIKKKFPEGKVSKPYLMEIIDRMF